MILGFYALLRASSGSVSPTPNPPKRIFFTRSLYWDDFHLENPHMRTRSVTDRAFNPVISTLVTSIAIFITINLKRMLSFFPFLYLLSNFKTYSSVFLLRKSPGDFLLKFIYLASELHEKEYFRFVSGEHQQENCRIASGEHEKECFRLVSGKQQKEYFRFVS